jgi:hypothetical protein
MKNSNFTATCSRTLLTFLTLNLGFLTLSFTPVVIDPLDEIYYITKSKISFLGKTEKKDWQVETTAVDCSGMFTTKEGELESISGFCFKVPINQVIKAISQADSARCRALQKSNLTEITFVQRRIMILPIMKMVHIIYDVKALGYTSTIPIQLQVAYIQGTNGQILLKGKQVVLLSELGIRLEQVDGDAKIDEVTIEIDFTVAKKQIP